MKALKVYSLGRTKREFVEIKLLKIGRIWKERRDGERGGGRRMRGEECVCVYESD